MSGARVAQFRRRTFAAYRRLGGAGAGLCLALAANPASADHPTAAFGAESAGPITTISATQLPRGSWAFGVRTELIDNDAFDTAQLEDFAAQGLEGVHSTDMIISTSSSLGYGLGKDLSISARIPYITRDNIREAELEGGTPGAHVHGDAAGIGDVLLFGQYRVLRKDNLEGALHLGLKAPTGETHDRDDDGIRFETEFQPGTGSWGYLFGGALSGTAGRFGYHVNLLYNATTEGAQSTELGDAFLYNAAIGYRLRGDDHDAHEHARDGHEHSHSGGHGLAWDLLLEINGQTRRKDRIAGAPEANSGGTTVYLSPGLKVSARNGWGAFISLGIPVIENPGGRQAEVEARLVAGLSLVIQGGR